MADAGEAFGGLAPGDWYVVRTAVVLLGLLPVAQALRDLEVRRDALLNLYTFFLH